MSQPANRRLVTEAALADALEGVKGGGVESVSGTVTLDATGPAFRQVYATGAATVQTEPLDAGQVAIFRYLAGAWQVRVMNADGSVKDPVWRAPGAPDTREAVNALAPTFSDDSAKGGGMWTTPSIQNVIYTPASGVAKAGEVVTVVATPSDPTKYRLDGPSSWTHTFALGPAPWSGVTATFAGAEGTSVQGLKTTTGNLTFESESGTNGALMTLLFMSNIPAQPLVLNGSNGAKHAAGAGTDIFSLAALTLPTGKFDVSIDYANVALAEPGQQIRFAVGNGTSARMAVIGTRSVGTEVYSGGWTRDTTVSGAFPTSGTVRFKSTGSLVELYLNGTLVSSKALYLTENAKFIFGVGRAGANPCTFSNLKAVGL